MIGTRSWVVRDMWDATFSDVLRARAAAEPDKKAFVFLDADGTPAEELTFGQIHHRALALASALTAHGLAGARVLLLFPPGLDFVAARHALAVA